MKNCFFIYRTNNTLSFAARNPTHFYGDVPSSELRFDLRMDQN